MLLEQPELVKTGFPERDSYECHQPDWQCAVWRIKTTALMGQRTVGLAAPRLRGYTELGPAATLLANERPRVGGRPGRPGSRRTPRNAFSHAGLW